MKQNFPLRFQRDLSEYHLQGSNYSCYVFVGTATDTHTRKNIQTCTHKYMNTYTCRNKHIFIFYQNSFFSVPSVMVYKLYY